MCSNWSNFHLEMDKLKNIFRQNGYPLNFICLGIKRFLDKKFQPHVRDDEPVCNLTVKIPYFGIQSIYFRKKLRCIFKKINNDLPIQWVFTCSKIKSQFSNKDKTPLILKSYVVYKFTCEVDPRTTYIGRTARHMNARIKEHRNYNSAISDHRLNCQCKCDSSNFKILTQAKDSFELNIKEAIYIKKLCPNLNKQLNHEGSFFSCKLI